MNCMFSEIVERVLEMDDHALDAELRRLEGLRRELAATEAVVLGEMDDRSLYRRDEHASMWGLLRAAVHWSDRDCKERMQLARLVAEFPEIGEALHDHRVSVTNAGELARVFANPRVGDELHDVIGAFGRLAERAEYDDLRQHVRGWERRTDQRDAHVETQTAHERRRAHWHADETGGQLVVEWGPLDAIANREILDHYEAAEWLTDWDATVEIYGDDATSVLMPRTADQRRADAVTAALADAASRAPGAKAPEPVTNVHLDYHSFLDLMVEAELFPERDTDPFEDPTPYVLERMCRTEHGDPIDPRTVLQLLLGGHVRWVIRNDQGIPIRWGRKQRLFKGAARDAARSLSTRCTHPGCRVPTSHTQTDHLIEWSRGGPTDPANGNPACRRHNLAKARGYRVHRDALGDWHTLRPDGTEIA